MITIEKKKVSVHRSTMEIKFKADNGESYLLGLPSLKYLDDNLTLIHMVSNAIASCENIIGEDWYISMISKIEEYLSEQPLYFKNAKDNNRSRIGTSIRTIRENKNMEAKELARKADMDAANLSRIEQGRFSTGVDTLGKIAHALDAKVEIVPNSCSIVKGNEKKIEIQKLISKVVTEDISNLALNVQLFCGAGIIVSDKIIPNSNNGWYEKLIVVTPHAKELSWAIEQIRDIYKDLISLDNKEPFYGNLADAANRYINSGDTSMKGLLLCVISEALVFDF